MRYTIIIILIVLLAIGIAFTIPLARMKRKEFKKTGKYPQGHYLGLGIALGLPLGYFVAFLLGRLLSKDVLFFSLGPSLGAGVGIVTGSILEKKNKDKLRPLTEKEQKLKNASIIIMLGLLLLGVVSFLFFLR